MPALLRVLLFACLARLAASFACWGPQRHVSGLLGFRGAAAVLSQRRVGLNVCASLKLGKTSTAKDVIDNFGSDLRGKTALVTGGNSGIGLETVKALSFAGCRVLLCCRNVEAGKAAVETEVKKPGLGGYSVSDPNIVVHELDLADLSSVEALADTVLKSEPRIDFLVLNAGVLGGPLRFTKQGFEMHIGVNHFGHFHLTNKLLGKLKSQEHASRIVCVSSSAHQLASMDVNDLHYRNGRKYSSWGAYCQSKLANALYVKGLHYRLLTGPASRVSTVAVHPGVIATPLWRDSASWVRRLLIPFLLRDKTVPQGAATTMYGCLAPDLEGLRGGVYLQDCAVATLAQAARDPDLRERFWAETERQIAAVLGPRAGGGAAPP